MSDKMDDTKSSTRKFSQNPRLGLMTDVGKKRKVDEDAILVMESVSGFESKMSQKFLLALADGMGGHEKGEIASKISVTTVAEKFGSSMLSPVNYASELENSIHEANKRILQYATEHDGAEGMGTTTVCAIVDKNEVHLAHVGDSRAYVISKEEIRQVTKDHSHVQDLIDKGEILESEATTHPKKNVITRAVGIYSEVNVDTMKLTLDEDEFLLLCCDGLIVHVDDKTVQEIVVNAEDPQDACIKLVNAANEKGGSDNISVILLAPQQSLVEKET
ncbi:MAG: Stp1/IreP family PP2C-type Ser/Thr phosphatase [Acidimicrobiales bacterium]